MNSLKCRSKLKGTGLHMNGFNCIPVHLMREGSPFDWEVDAHAAWELEVGRSKGTYLISRHFRHLG